MAMSSVNVSRVSFNQQINTLLSSLRSSSVQLLTDQTQLSSGLAFSSASENPAAAAQVLDLEGALGRQDQIVSNLQHASSMLDATDAAIVEIHALISDAHAIASQNIGPLATAEERVASAELIADIVEQLTTVGNREFNGSYLFAGRDTTEAPFVPALNGVAYTGDTGDVLAHVARLDDEPINLTGAELFGALSSQVSGTIDLSPALTEDTRLEDVVGARAEPLNADRLIIGDGAAGSVTTIDLTRADTLGDVVDMINEQGGGLVTAALAANGITLTPAGGAITVTELGSGTTAAGLGLLTTTASGGPISGDTLRRNVTRTTEVASLAGGAGVDLAGGLTITNGAVTAEIDLSAASTVQDLLNTINNAGLYVRARIKDDGTGIEIINEVSGAHLSIGENGGTTAADLGLRTLDLSTSLSSLNFGKGVETVAGQDDIRVTAKDGSTVDVNLDAAGTIGEVIDAITTAAADAGVAVSASLSVTGSGIRIEDTTGGVGSLSVSRLNFSYALDDLGLDQSVQDPATELIGDDVNTSRTDGVLTALVDLERALRADDDRAITEAAERVNGFVDEVNRVHGQVGARAQAMQSRLTQTENAASATEQLLSEVRDLDYTEAVTRFQQTQLALQATLMASSQSLNLSLMNFLG